MTILYVLELEHGKYYVGTTNRPLNDRILEHFNEYGSEWTRIHYPIKVIETKYNVDKYDEDKYTKLYMDKYGIDNVRGGSYVSVHLPEYQKKALEKELKTSNDKCFKCNKTGHYANDCKINLNNDIQVINDYSANIQQVHTLDLVNDKPINKVSIINKNQCYRCGRQGHWAKNCYAKTDVNGKHIIHNSKGYSPEHTITENQQTKSDNCVLF